VPGRARQFTEAVDQLARALPIVENGLGADHPRTGWVLSNYSELLNRVGRFAEAGRAAERALAILGVNTTRCSSPTR